jgi:MraZ protein
MFLRNLLEMANEAQLDSQARLSIPSELRDYAKIGGEVRIIGTLDKIELWNPEVYEKYKVSQAESYETIAEKVMK